MSRVWSDQLESDALGVVRVWVTDAGVRRVDFRSDPEEISPR